SRPLLLERLSRAIWLLKDEGFIVKPQYATYAITQKGLNALIESERSGEPVTEDVNADIYDVEGEVEEAAEVKEEAAPAVVAEPAPAPEVAVAPEPAQEVAAEPEPEVASEPEQVIEEAEPEVEAEVAAEPVQEPEAEPEIEVAAEPEPEQVIEEVAPEAEAAPEPEPEAEFNIQVVPDGEEPEQVIEEEAPEVEAEPEQEADDGIVIDETGDEDKEAEAELETEIEEGTLETLGDDAEVEEPEAEPEIAAEPEQVIEAEAAPEVEIASEPEEVIEEAEAAPEVEIAPEPEQVIEQEPEPESEQERDVNEMSNSELRHELELEIASVFDQFNETMAFEILDNVYGLSDAAFEQFVIDLLSKSGYHAFQNARYTQIKSGDESDGSEIHGLIMDEKNPIYIHAVRRDPTSVINDAEVEKFDETAKGKGGTGLFITTARFSEHAETFAEEHDMKLIDGYKTASLMMKHNFCVKLKDVFEIKSFDPDAFGDYED
ncbi:MAG: restriction endonuclease, partial [Synergistaceae bacterium]|nr:restriction endonuclease [Synergistaceae bacterium]